MLAVGAPEPAVIAPEPAVGAPATAVEASASAAKTALGHKTHTRPAAKLNFALICKKRKRNPPNLSPDWTNFATDHIFTTAGKRSAPAGSASLPAGSASLPGPTSFAAVDCQPLGTVRSRRRSAVRSATVYPQSSPDPVGCRWLGLRQFFPFRGGRTQARTRRWNLCRPCFPRRSLHGGE